MAIPAWLSIQRAASAALVAKQNGAKKHQQQIVLPDATAAAAAFVCQVSVRVTPGARSDSVTVSDTELCLKVTSPPVDGRANEAVIEYFDELLRSASDVALVSGATSRSKVVRFTWVASPSGSTSLEAAAAELRAILEEGGDGD